MAGVLMAASANGKMQHDRRNARNVPLDMGMSMNKPGCATIAETVP
jgi:hypothetical protein